MKLKTQKTVQQNQTGTTWKRICTYKHIYIMLIPVVAYYILFHAVPLYGITLAFRSFKPGGLYNMFFGGKWMGLQYFEQIFSDAMFWRAVKNTLILSMIKLVIYIPITIVFVLLLNELKTMKLKKFSQTISYLPHFLSWVVIGGIFIQLMSVNGAVTNLVIKITGNPNVSLLTDTKIFRWVLLISTIYKSLGWDTIIFLAALSGISQELYEAAECDGANRFRQVMHITLPSILPTISIVLLMNISSMLNGNFDQVYTLYNTSVYEVGDIIETYNYRLGISQGKFGPATAVGIFKTIIACTLLSVSNTFSRKLLGTGMY